MARGGHGLYGQNDAPLVPPWAMLGSYVPAYACIARETLHELLAGGWKKRTRYCS